MNAYTWTSELRSLYDKAMELYRSGNREVSAFFSEDEVIKLSEIGLKPINVFDYVEDYVKSGDPGWDTFLLVAAVRRDYFLHEQKRKPTMAEMSADELPAKTDAIEGIEWLPRIIQKAQCFLGGGLCHDIMYGCGGDRRFLQSHAVHSADLLRVVWAAKGDKKKVLDYLRVTSPLLQAGS
jgi:hypothetical protein